MNRELRIFLLAVGIPAVVLTTAGARLVYVEWRRATRPPPPRMLQPRAMPHGYRLPHPGWQQWGPRPMPPPPPHFVRLFSENYGMDGVRVLWIGGCILGLMFLSLMAGGWFLVREARRSRLEALRQTDFVSNVSHEFKTPLTTICLCAELAQDDALEPERRKRALASVVSEADRLKRLVLNVLDFSRLEQRRWKYSLAKVDLGLIVCEVCANFAERFPAGHLWGPQDDSEATADADAVRQIVTTLLDNAAKYAPTGIVEVSVAKTATGACVSVADRGPGLTWQERRRVFDRFWRGDNSVTRETGGNGLGLAIARSLARGMGGDLTVANREGGGAVFALELKS